MINRYYKGERFIVLETNESITKLQNETNSSIQKIVETKNLLTEEEFQKQMNNRRSNHVNWIR